MLRDYWYIACAGSRVDKAPKAARVLDQDIVVYRDRDGVAHALLDRCCHRGVKLSLGKVSESGHIACGYHGWQYDGASGRCVYVPSMRRDLEVPENFVVQAFPTIEQDSYIWVWMGEEAPHPKRPRRIDDFEGHSWRQGVSVFGCHATMVIENQFDACHPAYTHEGTHPASLFLRARGLREYSFELRLTDTGFTAFMPVAASEDDPIPEKAISVSTFDLPGRVFLRQKAMTVDFYLVLHVVPTGPTTCRMEWLQRMRGNEHGVEYVEEEPVINAQDRVVMESSQPWYDMCGRNFERSVEADHITMMVRKVIASAEAGTWDEERQRMRQRRLITFCN